MLCRVVARVPRAWYSVTTAGPLGVDRGIPLAMQDADHSGFGTGREVALTDPFDVYLNYVRAGYLQPDEKQLRAMKEIQKLYYRVRDYTPPEELNIRTQLLLLELKRRSRRERESSWILYLTSDASNKRKKNEVIKSLSHLDDSVVHSPQGLLVNGEVGCGKSMLIDIFASCLPHKSKMRWHFHNFILWVFNEMHELQTKRDLGGTRDDENDLMLFEIAQKMIMKNTVLILDEFMLPDIAAANIIKYLFTYYFRLGGVLIATSNKLPEDLYSNEFNKRQFHDFVGILHSRCQTIDMRSNRDYRTLTSTENAVPNIVIKSENRVSHDMQWQEMLRTFNPTEEWAAATVCVFKREITLSKTNGKVCYIDFKTICEGEYASSDYISILSHFHTIIIDHVPKITIKKKNEARRFITLLDALYELKCTLVLRCEVPIDELFFSEKETEESSMLDSEAFARATIDLSTPYRPNVSFYDQVDDFSESTRKTSSIKEKKDFADLKAFTGQDELFAYRRAVLRLKQMLYSPVWKTSGSHWVPLDASMRPWENEGVFNAMPVREAAEIPGVKRPEAPQFHSIQHFWALGKYGLDQGKRLKDDIARRWIRSSNYE